jgi:hypothetical protein
MNEAVDLINKSNEGYDQSQRWSFLKGLKIVKGKECDCSSLCGAIAKLSGYPVDISGTFYTGNIAAKLKAAGFKVLKYTNLAAVKVGDFLVVPGRHVEYVYSTDKFFSAHIDERGKASGGKAGNQTGKEVGFRPPYNHSSGWVYIVRPPEEKKPAAAKPTATTKAKRKVGEKVSFAELWTQADGGKKVKAAVKSGKITRVKTGAAHPYLVGNGLGWLSDKEIK